MVCHAAVVVTKLAVTVADVIAVFFCGCCYCGQSTMWPLCFGNVVVTVFPVCFALLLPLLVIDVFIVACYCHACLFSFLFAQVHSVNGKGQSEALSTVNGHFRGEWSPSGKQDLLVDSIDVEQF